MTLVLEPAHLTAMERHGEADYPREACGLIGGRREGDRRVAMELVRLVNAWTDSVRNRYLIDPDAYRRADARLALDELEVIGVYHSHPDSPAVPSRFDRDNAWPRLSYVIMGVARGRAGEMKSWLLADDRTAFAEEPITIEERKVSWQSQS